MQNFISISLNYACKATEIQGRDLCSYEIAMNCYDLDIWGQGQALRAFFVVMSFFTILSKV